VPRLLVLDKVTEAGGDRRGLTALVQTWGQCWLPVVWPGYRLGSLGTRPDAGEFEEVIMIEVVIEEMHGSKRADTSYQFLSVTEMV